MRKPRPEEFDPEYKSPKPEKVDLAGVVSIKPRKHPSEKTEHLKPENETTAQETTQPRNRDAVTPRYHATTIENVRKALKSFGKEAATHRFTEEEKSKIAEVVYAYKVLGIRTSENEITRIAVNFVLHDYQSNGEDSLLSEVLKALNE